MARTVLSMVIISALVALVPTARAELILNGGMEDWSGGQYAPPDHWDGSSQGRREGAAAQVHSGSYSARTTTGGSGVVQWHGQNFDVAAGTEYTVEAYIQLSSATARVLDVLWKDADTVGQDGERRIFVSFYGGDLRYYDGAWNDTGYTYDAADVGSDKWFRLQLRVVLDGDDSSGDGDRDQFYVSVSDPSSGSEALGTELGAFNFLNEQPESGPNPTARLTFRAQTSSNSYLDDISIVPEPATMGLLGIGSLGIAALRRRRRK